MNTEKMEQYVELQISSMRDNQEEFIHKSLLLFALAVKNIYSNEEAAMFLATTPKNLYQLAHKGKLKHLPKRTKGEKTFYSKSDLEDYLLNRNEIKFSENDFQDVEDDIRKKWEK